MSFLFTVIGDNPINYKINIDIDQAAVLVYDDYVSVKISLTSPLLREQNESGSILKEPIPNIDNTIDTNSGDTKLLPREPCLKVCFKFFYYLLYSIRIMLNFDSYHLLHRLWQNFDMQNGSKPEQLVYSHVLWCYVFYVIFVVAHRHGLRYRSGRWNYL